MRGVRNATLPLQHAQSGQDHLHQHEVLGRHRDRKDECHQGGNGLIPIQNREGGDQSKDTRRRSQHGAAAKMAREHPTADHLNQSPHRSGNQIEPHKRRSPQHVLDRTSEHVKHGTVQNEMERPGMEKLKRDELPEPTLSQALQMQRQVTLQKSTPRPGQQGTASCPA